MQVFAVTPVPVISVPIPMTPDVTAETVSVVVLIDPVKTQSLYSP
jgi:hypothetical protein